MATNAGWREGERIRDAERSREAILGAAEELFAEKGFDGVSLGEIAAAAGLSRGAPSYFFGSKAELYRAALQRAFAEREEATRRACEPLLSWAGSKDAGPIEPALAEAVGGYLDFLLRHPAFVALIQHEELAGGGRLREVPREARAIEDAFRSVRAVAEERGLGRFDVADAVLVFVSLTFSPLAQRATFMASLGIDLSKKSVRRRHVDLVVAQLIDLIQRDIPGIEP